jgi:hypothetical protein
MNRIYSYSDYEYAYYHQQWSKCIEIGKYLLPFIHNDRANKLLKKLSKAYYAWNIPEDESKELAQLLLDVKVWIMVHENY